MKIKKIATLLVLVTLAMSLLVAMPASAATNYLSVWNNDNSYGMEEGSDAKNHLVVPSTLNAENGYSAEAARSGNLGLYVTTKDGGITANSYIDYKGTQNLTMGEDYVFSLWVKIPTAFEGTNCGVRLRLTSGSTNKYSSFVTNTQGEWKKLSVAFNDVPASSVDFRLGFFGSAQNSIPANTTFYIDDFSIELNSEIKADEAKRFSTTSDYYTSGKYMYYDALDAVSENWSSTSTFDLTWPTTGSFAGCMKVDVHAGAETDSYVLAQPYVKGAVLPDLELGKTYEASVWAYIPNEYASYIQWVALEPEGARKTGVANENYLSEKLATNGVWRRISTIFSPTEDHVGRMTAMRLKVCTNAKAAVTVYFDNLVLVEKTTQSPVLQILKPQLKSGAETDYVYFDAKKPGDGAFVVQYDVHKTDATNTGNALVSAIYKEIGGVKQLVEVSVACFDADDSKVSVNMQGVETPDNSYTVRTMLWNSLWGMRSLKYTDSVKLN